MKVFAYTLELRESPELIEAYKKHHQSVWPEVLSCIEKSGVRRSRIFLLGNRLFLYTETDDDYQGLESYVSDDRARKWDELMRNYQQPVKEAKPGELWAPMELIYDFEEQSAAAKKSRET